MTFHVGQKVVCVDSKPRNGFERYLTKGEIYTVRGFCRNIYDKLGILLVEVRSPRGRFLSGEERGFRPDRFRPVVSRPTSIAIFTAMLNPSQVTVDAMNTADFARESAG